MKKKKRKPFQIEKDQSGKYFWIVTAGENQEALARSSESYSRRIDCVNGAKRVAGILSLWFDWHMEAR